MRIQDQNRNRSKKLTTDSAETIFWDYFLLVHRSNWNKTKRITRKKNSKQIIQLNLSAQTSVVHNWIYHLRFHTLVCSVFGTARRLNKSKSTEKYFCDFCCCWCSSCVWWWIYSAIESVTTKNTTTVSIRKIHFFSF